MGAHRGHTYHIATPKYGEEANKMSPLWYFKIIQLLRVCHPFAIFAIIIGTIYSHYTVSAMKSLHSEGGRSLGVWNECGSRIILWYATSPTTHPSTIISSIYYIALYII